MRVCVCEEPKNYSAMMKDDKLCVSRESKIRRQQKGCQGVLWWNYDRVAKKVLVMMDRGWVNGIMKNWQVRIREIWYVLGGKISWDNG